MVRRGSRAVAGLGLTAFALARIASGSLEGPATVVATGLLLIAGVLILLSSRFETPARNANRSDGARLTSVVSLISGLLLLGWTVVMLS